MNKNNNDEKKDFREWHFWFYWSILSILIWKVFPNIIARVTMFSFGASNKPVDFYKVTNETVMKVIPTFQDWYSKGENFSINYPYLSFLAQNLYFIVGVLIVGIIVYIFIIGIKDEFSRRKKK